MADLFNRVAAIDYRMLRDARVMKAIGALPLSDYLVHARARLGNGAFVATRVQLDAILPFMKSGDRVWGDDMQAIWVISKTPGGLFLEYWDEVQRVTEDALATLPLESQSH